MNLWRSVAVASGALILWSLSGCSGTTQKSTDKKTPAAKSVLTVYVVNYPLKYFAERVGGECIEVHFPAPSDEDPAFWNPTPETIAQFQQADLILLNGAGYAKWTATATLPKGSCCDTSAAFAEDYIALTEEVTHSHGPTGKHAHGATAFTTWLDPKQAVHQAELVRAALAKRMPQATDTFQKNFNALQKDLKALDDQLAKAVSCAPLRPVIFSHPVYQYLQRCCGLNGKSVHWEPDEAPTDKQWDELKTILKDHPAKWMIWEAQPGEVTVKKLSEMGIQSAVVDPCGNTPATGDYLSVQKENVRQLAKVFAE